MNGGENKTRSSLCKASDSPSLLGSICLGAQLSAFAASPSALIRLRILVRRLIFIFHLPVSASFMPRFEVHAAQLPPLLPFDSPQSDFQPT